MTSLIDRMCLLFVTHQCNLNCVYCYEKFKSPKRMTLETAKRVLADELRVFEERATGGTLTIDFMGGEPLLNFDVIRETCRWLWESYPNAPYRPEMRTNGTALTPESMKWLEENRSRIHVGLSLDGIEELQDMNRSGSSSKIPVGFFLRNWPDIPLKTTISPQSLPLLAASAISFHERGIPFSLTLAQGVDWGDEAPQLLKEQLLTLADYYTEHPELKPEPSLFVDDFRGLSRSDPPSFPMCGTREEIVAYNADGERSICHLFTEPTIGIELAKLYRDKTNTPTILPEDPDCAPCPARPICKRCPGFNLVATGSLHLQDKRVCRMMRTLVHVNCIIWLKKNEQRALRGELDEEEMQLLRWALDHLEPTDPSLT